MIIIVDSREQRPLVFKCEIIKKGLKFGDYGALFSPDYNYPVIFERKNIADLFGTLTQGYDRFRREIDRAEKAKVKLVIAIEGTKEKVLEGYKHSKRDPASIIKQLETIERKYGVTHMFFASRIAMANHIQEFYEQEYRKFIHEA
tara:strand:+ start:2326 stop:2760 length:435 start_codon:yes stop_codon:yes gene_type:complete